MGIYHWSIYLAALLALGISLVFSMVFGLLVLQLMGQVQLAAGHWGKLVFVVVTALLYLSCFVLIGLLCSIFGRNATIAAMAFLFSWTFLVFIVPNLGGILAGRVGDMRTPYQINELRANIGNRIPVTAGMDARDEGRVRLEREYAKEELLIEYVREMVRQVDLGKKLTRVSPASTFVYAVEGVTGGGIQRLVRFVDNAVRFRAELFETILEADLQDPESDHRYTPWYFSSSDINFSRRTVDLGPAKEFDDSPPSGAAVLEVAFMDLALLVLYNGVLFLLAFWRFARQDVTPGSIL